MVADCELAVRDAVWFPNGVAGWVSVPLRVLFRGVAEVVEFVGGIIEVDVDGVLADCAVDLVGCVFYLPEPI